MIISLSSLKVTVFFISLCFNMASFRGQKKPGPRPGWSPFRRASLPFLYGSAPHPPTRVALTIPDILFSPPVLFMTSVRVYFVQRSTKTPFALQWLSTPSQVKLNILLRPPDKIYAIIVIILFTVKEEMKDFKTRTISDAFLIFMPVQFKEFFFLPLRMT